MSSKHKFLFLIFVVISIGIMAFLFNPFNSSSKNSFLDDLQAGLFGKGISQHTYNINISFVDFKLNLKEGEIFNYSEILFDDDCGNLVLNSSYIVAGKEYKNSTECYVIQYYKEYINERATSCEGNILINKSICTCNFTIANDNGNLSLCTGKREPMFYDEKPFFGIVDENFTATSEALHSYKYRYGLYKGEGNVTLKTEMKVVGKDKINERNVYVINITSENLNLDRRTPKLEVKTISQIFIDDDKGIIIKRIDYYNEGNKINEKQLINL